jgi:YVTN family beta-propeller protein
MKKGLMMMKKGKSFVAIASFWLLACMVSGCEDAPLPNTDPELPGLRGVFILNQGGNNQNNASLSFYSPETGDVSTVSLPSASEPGKNEALGDLGQDMMIYGSKLYVVVSNSSYIRVLDVETKQTLAKIALFDSENKPRNPRYLAAFGGKVYATCVTDGSVVRIDTVTLLTDGNVKVGAYPEGIAASSFDSKLYVANSGWGTGHTVSVVDIATFHVEEASIETGQNPYIVRASADPFIYLSYQGNFADIAGGFQRIDLRDYSVTTLGSYPKADFAWENGEIYYYDVTYDPVDWSTEVSCGKFDDRATTYTQPSPLITDGTTLTAPFGIGVEPTTGNVYIADAGDYSNPGTVLVFSPEGALIRTLSVGVSPCKIVFY